MNGDAGFQSNDTDESRLFLARPSRYADPSRLISCFGQSIGPDISRKLLAAGRLEKRLSRLLEEHFQLPLPISEDDNYIADGDRPVAFAPGDRLAEIALRAGAVYWAATLVHTISGHEATALREQLGAALCSVALTNKDLTGPEQPLYPLATIRERVEIDGWKCLAAWCDAVGPLVATRVRLKLPQQNLLEEPAEPAFATIGPLIVRRIAD